MPDEVFSEQNHTADDGGPSKVLFCDLVCQMRVLADIALVNATNCYDRIAYVIASLIFQSFGVEDMTVEAILAAIQQMRCFLKMAYGDSSDFIYAAL